MIADRVTIDIDHYVPSAGLKALRAYYTLQNHRLVDEVRVHVSTGGKGVHVQGYLTERLEDDERDALRRSLNDDTKRADLDRQRGDVGHATDIYWDEKDGNDGEREEVPDIWSALDRIEANRASDLSRMKAIQKHGHKGVWDLHHGPSRASLVEGL